MLCSVFFRQSTHWAEKQGGHFVPPPQSFMFGKKCRPLRVKLYCMIYVQLQILPLMTSDFDITALYTCTYVICMHICELRCLYVYLFVILRIFIINCLPQSVYCSHKQTTYNGKLCWYHNTLLYTGCFVDDKISFNDKYLKVFV